MKIKATAVASLGSDDHFRLTITDESSRIQFVYLKMTPDEFARMISARVTTDLECEVRGLDGVGKIRETKTERVPFKMFYGGTDEERVRAARQALERFEVDGWKGRVSDLFNGHRIVRDCGRHEQFVTFDRLIDAPTNTPAASGGRDGGE